MTVDNLENEPIILATGGYDHTIKLWQTHTGICQRTLQHSESQVNALEITPDKQHLAAASYQQIYMYDLTTNTAHNKFYGTSLKNFVSVGFNTDGKWMYAGGEDSTVRIWDLRSQNNQAAKLIQVESPITCMCLHPNQVELFVGDQSGIIYRLELRTDKHERLIPMSDAMVLGLDIDRKGTHMASVNNKGLCYIWSLESGNVETPTKMTPKHCFQAHKRYALHCKFSPDTQYLVTTSADQTAKIWKISDFSLVQVLTQESQRWVWDAAFSADSQYIFTASSDNYAKLWNVNTGALEREYAGHQKAVTALAFRENS